MRARRPSETKVETVATVQVCAPAKVNLVLRVLGRRPDGYHEVWSLLQTVGLEDELTVRVRPGSSGLQVQCDDADLPTDGRNLVHRAAALVLERAGKSVGLEIRLSKRIPVSAGLGGGSSDAAATIAALNHVLGLGWSAGVMAQVGEALGSDVPFFFFAPTAWVRGRGEAVSALTVRGTRWVVLVYPGFPIGTRWAYDQLSAMRDQVRPMREAHQQMAAKSSLSWDEVIPLMENDFEEVLASTHGIVREIRRKLLAEGAEAALLSGSGSSVFGLFHDEEAAARARASFSRTPGWRTYAVPVCAGPFVCRETSTPDSLARIIHEA